MWNVTVSSCVMARTKGRPMRSSTFLRADGVHLLADDLRDLFVHAPAQGQEGPESCRRLADEAASHQEAVTDRFGIAGVLPQGGDEELRGLHAWFGRWCCHASDARKASPAWTQEGRV